jgi:phospholipid/cholesterol/gamma-HCH transport system permease protein
MGQIALPRNPICPTVRAMTQPADLLERDDAQGRTVSLSGSLSLSRLGDLPQRLDAIDGEVTKVDLGQIDHIDTIGAWVIHRFALRTSAKIIGADENARRLLDAVARNDMPLQALPVQPNPVLRVLGEVGLAARMTSNTMLGLLGFLGATVVATGHLIRHPGSIRINAVVQRLEVVGIKALAIVGLMSFLVGIVIAQQGSVQLRAFGMEVLTVNLVGRLTFRELGVLMTAIMVAGRSGSAFAAQIGTMQLNEEVDAMRTIGVQPMEALVMPRILASVIMMPLLGFYASIIAILGGMFLCAVSLDIPPITFIQRLREVVPITDLFVGLVKAPVFGLIIGIAGCFQGLQVRGNAEEVGLRTTAAVVQAIFLVIVVDAVFAVFFTWIGWN